MNLIDDEFENNKPDNSKKIAKMILIFMLLLIIAIIGTFFAIIYIQSNTLKFYINGASNEKAKQLMLIEEDGTIYFPIKAIAPYLGYESYNGEYTDKSEEPSKCYVQCEDEITNFALNSNKIYKLLISNNNANYEYFNISKPVKAINGELYATTDALEKAFNISFSYDINTKTVSIYTIPYLIDSIYSARVLDYGYEAISESFTNKKTVLNSMLVVTKNQNKVYGIIDVTGKTIIEPKYDYIEYIPNSGDFLVTSNGKVGIISAEKETKVQILYDSLQLIDQENGLYLAKRDNKYGVIDSKGNIKIYIEYDQIGIENSPFEKNDIKNKYLLDNGMIPARKDKLWGAFDKNGREVLPFEYDSFGYIASSNKDAINLLMIPEYNVMVARKNKKYVLIGVDGRELCYPVLDDVYMSISSGQKHYYMNYGENIGMNVIEFLKVLEVEPVKDNSSNNQNSNQNKIEENEIVEDYEETQQEEEFQEEIEQDEVIQIETN